MIVTIDNLDGAGPIDYTGALDASAPLRIERALNVPSRCHGLLALSGQAMPVRRGRIVVASDQGTLLFTGYLAVDPVQEYAGEGFAGPVYRTSFDAVSDEWLLDKQAVLFGGAALNANSGTVLKTLASRTGGANLTTAGVQNGP